MIVAIAVSLVGGFALGWIAKAKYGKKADAVVGDVQNAASQVKKDI